MKNNIKKQVSIMIAPRKQDQPEENKKEMRKEIEIQTENFLKNGGEVEFVDIKVHKEHRNLKERQSENYSRNMNAKNIEIVDDENPQS
jgi:hypothetical protein